MMRLASRRSRYMFEMWFEAASRWLSCISSMAVMMLAQFSANGSCSSPGIGGSGVVVSKSVLGFGRCVFV